MADITICTNTKCSKKDTCYTYNAKPDEYWQSYFCSEEKDCKDYIRDEG